jgi:thiosulfate/3-mercaptopyruvate sulfurtransferase
VFGTLVSTVQLANHLGSWAVIDCRFDLRNQEAGLRAYRASHIPGAAYASLATDLSAPLTGTNGRHPLPSVDAMAETFSTLGIGPGTQVVAYDEDTGMYASRLWWMLRYLGHDAVAVLDGGFAKWTREQREVRSGSEQRPPARFVPGIRPEWLVTIDQMVGDRAQSALLVDARAPERFEGRSETLDRAAGHIPGAVNRFFKDNTRDDGTMRPAGELRRTWTEILGTRSPDDVVMYCGSGVTACHNLLALEHAGICGASLFVGSWSEWSADPARPIETGPAAVRPPR